MWFTIQEQKIPNMVPQFINVLLKQNNHQYPGQLPSQIIIFIIISNIITKLNFLNNIFFHNTVEYQPKGFLGTINFRLLNLKSPKLNYCFTSLFLLATNDYRSERN